MEPACSSGAAGAEARALASGAKQWTTFAHGPLPSRIEPTSVWTGSSLIVWGGLSTKTWGKYDETGGVFTPPVLACGDDWMGENLSVTPSVKAALRTAYLAAHPRARVVSPAQGSTYYGMYSGTSYALATFGSAPTVFRTDARGHWHVRAETDGRICTNVVPVELVKSGRCGAPADPVTCCPARTRPPARPACRNASRVGRRRRGTGV